MVLNGVAVDFGAVQVEAFIVKGNVEGLGGGDDGVVDEGEAGDGEVGDDDVGSIRELPVVDARQGGGDKDCKDGVGDWAGRLDALTETGDRE